MVPTRNLFPWGETVTIAQRLPAATPGMKTAGWIGVAALLGGQVGNSGLLQVRLWDTPWARVPWVALALVGTVYFAAAVLACAQWAVSAGWPRWSLGVGGALAVAFALFQASLLLDPTRGVVPVTGPPLLGVVLRLDWVARYASQACWVALFAFLGVTMVLARPRRRLWGALFLALALVSLTLTVLWIAEPARREFMERWRFDGLLATVRFLSTLGSVSFLAFLFGWRVRDAAPVPAGAVGLRGDPASLLLLGTLSLWFSYLMVAFMPQAALGLFLVAAWSGGGAVYLVGGLFMAALQAGSAFLAWWLLRKRRRALSLEGKPPRLWGNRLLEALSLLLLLALPAALLAGNLARHIPAFQRLLTFLVCGRPS